MRQLEALLQSPVAFFGGGLGLRSPITQTRFCDVIETYDVMSERG